MLPAMELSARALSGTDDLRDALDDTGSDDGKLAASARTPLLLRRERGRLVAEVTAREADQHSALVRARGDVAVAARAAAKLASLEARRLMADVEPRVATGRP
jgi:hypothetical protein